MKNFGEFYNNQIENASTIILSLYRFHPPEQVDVAVAMLREHNSLCHHRHHPSGELTRSSGQALDKASRSRR